MMRPTKTAFMVGDGTLGEVMLPVAAQNDARECSVSLMGYLTLEVSYQKLCGAHCESLDSLHGRLLVALIGAGHGTWPFRDTSALNKDSSFLGFAIHELVHSPTLR